MNLLYQLNLQLRISKKMGQLLTNIQSKKDFFRSQSQMTQELWSERLDRIKEYHGMFKYVCDSFVITHEEFKEIFGNLEKVKIWDPEKKGRIDALQIFCGLTIFARDCTFKKKLSFIFNLFDFNEIKSLSFVDVQVMILCICKSVYKIMDGGAKINENQICEWLAKYLPKFKRIKITTLYYLCTTKKEILNFLSIIQQTPEELPQEKDQEYSEANINDLYLIKSMETETYFEESIPEDSRQLSQQTIQTLNWHQSLSDKLICGRNSEEDKPLDQYFYPTINWVYGINSQGYNPPFIVTPNRSILYKTSNLAVRYYLDINQQEILCGNQLELKCIAYCSQKDIIATIDSNNFTSIYLWRKVKINLNDHTAKGYEKYGCIKTSHSQGIRLAQFIPKNNYLVTVGNRADSPIIVYDVNSKQGIHKLTIGQPIYQLFSGKAMIDESEIKQENQNKFFVRGIFNVYEVSLDGKNKQTVKTIISNNQIQEDRISYTVALYMNQEKPYVHSFNYSSNKKENRNLILVCGFESGKCKLYYFQNNSLVEQELSDLEQRINCIQISFEVVILCTQTKMYIYDLDFLNTNKIISEFYQAERIKMIDLKSAFQKPLISYKIRHFQFIGSQILLLTQAGQFLLIKASKQYKPYQTELNTDNFIIQISMIDTIINFNQNSPCKSSESTSNISNSTFCLLTLPQTVQQCDDTIDNSIENQPSELILISSQGNKILGINSLTHQLEDLWELSSNYFITQIEAICADDGICYVVCACKGGKLLIRIDWEESPKFYNCKSQILDVKISKDSSYLLVATQDQHLLFFTQINKNFISPRKIFFQNEIPLSINFLDNFKFFTVVTSAQNTYIIQIPNLKHKNLSKQTDKIYSSKMVIKCPQFSSNKKAQNILESNPNHQSINSVFGSQMQFSIINAKDNLIYFFNSPNSLKNSNFAVLNAHVSSISTLQVNSNQKKFYSLGRYDNTLIQWKVEEKKYRRYDKNRYYKEYQNIVSNFSPLLPNQYMKNSYLFDEVIGLTVSQNQKIDSFSDTGSTFESASYYQFSRTKSDKINKMYEKYWSIFEDKNQKIKAKTDHETQEDSIYAMKRAPNYSLVTHTVYGIEGKNPNCVQYSPNGKQIITFTSRFIIKIPSKNSESKLSYHEETDKKITNLLLCEGSILYSISPESDHKSHHESLNTIQSASKGSPNHSLIYIHPFGHLRTTHNHGIINIKSYNHFILSYGIAGYSTTLTNQELTIQQNRCHYSINLHNIHTKQLIVCTYTHENIRQFIFFNQLQLLTIGAYDDKLALWNCGTVVAALQVKATAAAIIRGKNLKNYHKYKKLQLKHEFEGDLLIGVGNGTLCIMNKSGIFQIVRQAHEKPISHILVSTKMSKVEENQQFPDQIITCGKDERIKIWSDTFECKIMISLREQILNNFQYLSKTNLNKEQGNLAKVNKNYEFPYNIRIQSINIHNSETDNKVIVALDFGRIIEIELLGDRVRVDRKRYDETNFSNIQSFQSQIISENKILSNSSLVSKSESSVLSSDLDKKQKNGLGYIIHEIFNTHSFFTFKENTIEKGEDLKKKYDASSNNRRVYFSLHPNFPIIATISGENQLLIRNYETQKLLNRYFFKNKSLTCLKFSPIGNLLLLCFDTGEICMYEFLVSNPQKSTNKRTEHLFKSMRNNSPPNNNTELRLCQSINDDSDLIVQFVNVQFSDCGGFLALSVITSSKNGGWQGQNTKQRAKQNERQSEENKESNYLKAKIFIYHTRNTQLESGIKYYTLYEKVEIMENHQPNQKHTGSKKANLKLYNTKLNQGEDKEQPKTNKTKKLVKSAYFLKFLEEEQNWLQNSTKKNQCTYLAYYQQFIVFTGNNVMRIFNDKKIKTKIYSIPNRKHLNEDNLVGILKWKFPHLINARRVSIMNQKQFTMHNNMENQELWNEPVSKTGNSSDQKNQAYQEIFDQVSYSQFYQRRTEVGITDMCIYKNLVFYGDEQGKIHLVKLSSLLPKNPHNQNITDGCSSLKDESSLWNMSKTYSSQTAPIVQMEINYNSKYLFVNSSENGQCIVQYEIVRESEHFSELDNQIYPINLKEDYNQYLSRPNFYDFLNTIEPLREEIPDVLMDTEQEIFNINHKRSLSESKNQSLSIRKFIGRSAFYCRRNLFHNYKNCLVYPLGANLIIQQLDQPCNQRYLPSSPLKYTSAPKITAIDMTKKYTIIGTQQQLAHIYVWDIHTMTCVGMCRAGGMSLVYKIIAHSTSKQLQKDETQSNLILIYGVNMRYEYSIQLLDWKTGCVLGIIYLPYSGGWRIRDICPVYLSQWNDKYRSQIQYVSCGVKHLNLIEFRANTLVSTSFNCIKGKTTFTAICTVKKMPFLFISCEEGKIYVFKQSSLELVTQIRIHECCIRELHIEENRSVFQLLSAGIDGKLIISTIGHTQDFTSPETMPASLSIQPIEEYDLAECKMIGKEHDESKLLTELDIQSIVVSPSSDKFYVGTASGDIFEIGRNRSNYGQNYEKQYKQIGYSHDNNTIVNMEFDFERSNIFYLLTGSGTVEIWSLKTLRRLYLYNLNQTAFKMFSYSNYLTIICSRSIITLSVLISNYSPKITNKQSYKSEVEKQNSYEFLINYEKGLSKEYDGLITEAIFTNKSSALYILVMSIKKNELNQILINEISSSCESEEAINKKELILEEKHNVLNLKYEIQFMDFSIDNKFLLFKDNFEEIGMVNLIDYKRFNTIFVEMGIQWKSEGIRISPHGQKIYTMYSRENQITKVRRLNKSEKGQIIIGDEMGTIRIFDYPMTQQKVGELHSYCFTNHMNYINNIQVHPHLPYVLTSSVFDKAVIVWEKIENQTELE